MAGEIGASMGQAAELSGPAVALESGDELLADGGVVLLSKMILEEHTSG